MSDLKGASQLQARIKAIGQTEPLMRAIIIRGRRNALLRYTRQSKKTGNLGRTIRPGHITATKGELIAGGRNRIGYAGDVERGTRPHLIRPRKGKVLAWGGQRRLSGNLRTGAKPTHFAALVHHPGSRAKPYLVPGLQEAAAQEGLDTVVSAWNKAG